MPTNSQRSRAALLATLPLLTGFSFALNGCAPTQASLEQHAPTIEARSAHSVAELSACMSDNLTRFSESTVNFVPRPDGATLTYNFVGAPFLTVTMIDHGSFRQVTTYGPYGLHTKVTRHRLDAVQTCL